MTSQQRVLVQLSSEKEEKHFQDPKNLLPSEISATEISTVLATQKWQILAFLGAVLEKNVQKMAFLLGDTCSTYSGPY